MTLTDHGKQAIVISVLMIFAFFTIWTYSSSRVHAYHLWNENCSDVEYKQCIVCNDATSIQDCATNASAFTQCSTQNNKFGMCQTLQYNRDYALFNWAITSTILWLLIVFGMYKLCDLFQKAYTQMRENELQQQNRPGYIPLAQQDGLRATQPPQTNYTQFAASP